MGRRFMNDFTFKEQLEYSQDDKALNLIFDFLKNRFVGAKRIIKATIKEDKRGRSVPITRQNLRAQTPVRKGKGDLVPHCRSGDPP